MPDLQQLLSEAAPRPAAPVDTIALWRDGRRRRNARRGLTALTAIALLLAGIGTVSALSDPVVQFADSGEEAAAAADTEAEAAPSDPVVATAPAVLRIGALLPLSGELDDLGAGMLAAVELAVDDLNAAGGVLGQPVELIIADSADGPENETALQGAVDHLLAQEVTAVVGPVHGSFTSRDAVSRLTEAGTLVLSPSATGGDFGEDSEGMAARLAIPESLQGLALARAITDSGATRVAVLARDDGYGKRLGAALEDGLSDTGVEVVSHGRYSDNPAATVVTDLVASAAAAAPDAVVLLGFQEAGAFLTELAANGIGTDRVWGGNALGGEEAPLLGAEGVRGVRHLATDDSAFTARLLDARPELEGTFFAAASYDAVVTVALATATASSDTGRDIADALAGVTRPGAANCTDVANCLNLVEEGAAITYDGALGVSDLGEANQPDGGTFEVFQIEADGSRPTIGTVSTATR